MKSAKSNPFRSHSPTVAAFSVALFSHFAAPSVFAVTSTWTGISGNWTDTGIWSGGTIADGLDSTANFTGVDITADQTITLTAPQTIGNITFTDAATPSHNLLITGANPLTLDVTSGTPAINVTQSGRTLVIASAIAGNDGLQKTGAGSLTLSGAAVNTFTGGLNANGGPLTLDYNNLVTPTNLVPAANALQLNNGEITITGKSNGNTAQTFAGTTLGGGVNAINISRNGALGDAALNLGALTTTAGSVTTINPGTIWTTGVLSTTEIIKVSGITGKTLPAASGTANWINVNAGLFYRQSASAGAARWVNVDNLGQLAAVPAAIAAQGVSGTVTTARQISTANITLTGSANSYGLVVNSDNAGRTLNLGTGSFTYTINGILGVNTFKAIIASGTGGTVVIGSERNLAINMDNTGGVDINAPIVNNGGGASSVTIASTAPTATTPGAVTFGGANTYTGATTIANGSLSLTNATPLGTTPGTNGTSGISINAGAVLQSALTGTNPSTTIAAPITLGAGGNTTLRIGQGAASNTHTFNLNGAIGGTTNNLVFTTTTGSFGNGSSLFVLGAASNYTGNTLITTGDGGNNPVFVRNGVVNALPTTTVLTFAQVSGGGTGRTFQYDLNGNNQTLAGLDNGGVVPSLRRMNMTNSSSTLATLTINNTANYTFGGADLTSTSTNRAQIFGAIALTKSGTGTFTLGGTLAGGATAGGHTFTGDTKILGGILSLGETLSLQNSALDTANSITGDATNGLRTTVTSLTLGGLTGNKNLASVFTSTSGGYTGLTTLTLNSGSGVTNTYSADIGNGAGALNLIKTGAGTQVLSGTNTFTGTTTGSAGILLATQAAALPGYNVPGKVVFNGGTISVQIGGSGWTSGEVDTLLANATKTSGAFGIDTTNGSFTQWTPFTPTNLGVLGLNKLGANDLTLNQANSYTGTTTVTAGTLTLANANALQNSPLVTTGAGTVTLGSGTILNLGGLNSATGNLATVISNYSTITNLTLNAPAGALLSYGGIIADGVPGMTVTKTGAGAQALTGANTYTGATQIDGGILTFGNKASKTAATATAAAAGSIGLGVHATDTAYYPAADVDALFNNNSLFGFSLNTASGVAIDTTNAGGSFDQTIALTAARSLCKTGSGILVLSQVNSHAGSTSVLAGTLSLTGSLTGGGAVSTSGSSVFSQTSTGVISGASTFTQGSSGTSTLAGTNTYTGVTNVNLGQLTIANTAALGTTDGNTIVTSGGRLAMNTASLSVAEPLTITGTGTTATNGAIAFGGGFTGMALTGPITLGGAARIQADGNTGSTLSGGISLGANVLTINADGGATQTIDTTAITGAGGSLVKSGSGTLVLGAANSYSGVTTLSAGTLSIGSIANTGAASPIGAGDNTSAASNTASLVFNGGTLAFTGTTGTTDRGFTMTGNGAITFPAGNNNALTFSGNLTGAGTLTLNGSSTVGLQNVLTLSGSNADFTGNVAATVGGIKITNSTGLGSGTKTITLNNGSAGNSNIQLDGSGGDITLPSTFTYAVSNINSGAIVNIAGNNTVAGQINNTSGGGGFKATSLGGNLTISANYTATTTLRAVLLDGPSNGTVSGIISNGSTVNLPVTKSGSGTWTLTGVNTYTGATTISAGTLVIDEGSIATSSSIVNNAALEYKLTTNARTYANVISGTGTLTKSGTNSLTLSGVNTYSGNTTVSAGTLTLSNAASALNANTGNDASTVTIAATGATLDLTYTGTDTVDKLFIGATQLAAGVYGPSATSIPQITGTGTLTVTSGPVGGYSSWQAVNGPTTQAINLDHDSDGVSNGIEYFLGGSTNTTGFTALPGVTNTAGTLSVTWTKAAGYTGTYGTDFVVETSSTLSGVWTTEIVAPTPGATVTITGNDVKYTFPAGTKNFARLKVTGP